MRETPLCIGRSEVEEVPRCQMRPPCCSRTRTTFYESCGYAARVAQPTQHKKKAAGAPSNVFYPGIIANYSIFKKIPLFPAFQPAFTPHNPRNSPHGPTLGLD